MRNSQRVEIAQISGEVTRHALTHSNVLAEVTGVLQASLPDMIRGYSVWLLPQLAKNAVEAATPDPAAIQAAAVAVVRASIEAELPSLVSGIADRLLPELASAAVRAAAPDPAEVRSELVESANAEVSEAVRCAAETAAEKAMRSAADDIGDTLAEMAEKIAAEVVPTQVRTAIERAVPDTETLSAQVLDNARTRIRELVDSAVPELIRTATTDTLASVRTAVDDARVKAVENIGASVDVAVDRKLAEFTPNIVEVVLPRQRKVRLGSDAHKVLPELLVTLNARCHVLLVGPAGTGKSMLAKHAAQALELQFQALSLGPTTPMSKVFGYFDANGEYHDTAFRRAFEHGGVMLLDELDNGHPGLLAELNQALALGTCAFADRMVDAHDDFRLVATGNTYGTGANRQYVGRQALDAATLDRFVVIDVPIDERLEERIALRHAPSHQKQARELVARIRKLRKLAEEKNLPVIISPRASIDGAKLLQAGATTEQVLLWRVTRGLSATQRKALGLD